LNTPRSLPKTGPVNLRFLACRHAAMPPLFPRTTINTPGGFAMIGSQSQSTEFPTYMRRANTPRYPGNARASGREVLLLPGAFLCPGPAAPHPAQTKKRPRRSRAGGRINAPVHVRGPTRPNWGGGRSLLDITLSGMTRCHPRVVPSPGPPCASRPGGSGAYNLDLIGDANWPGEVLQHRSRVWLHPA
jgi:hypothetical protein